MFNQFLNKVSENTKYFAWEDDKQLRPVLFKAMKKQLLPLTPLLL